MVRRTYDSHKRGVKVFLIVLVIVLLAAAGLACNEFNLTSNSKISSQFDTKLTEIGFKSGGVNLFGIIVGGDTLSIPGDRLFFKVDVIPKDSFTGEPFSINELGNKDIGFKTIVESRPAVYLALFSRDGYYFGSWGPLIWTKEELQLPDISERDYYKAQNIKERRIKHVTISALSSDKAVVALLKASNELMKKLEQEQWEGLVSGDLFSETSGEYVWNKFEDLFNRYFKVVIIDKEQRLKYENPD